MHGHNCGIIVKRATKFPKTVHLDAAGISYICKITVAVQPQPISIVNRAEIFLYITIYIYVYIYIYICIYIYMTTIYTYT